MTDLPVEQLARELPDDAAWHLKTPDDADHAHLFIGEREGAIRGVLDREQYQVRESDVPVREGWLTLLEISH